MGSCLAELRKKGIEPKEKLTLETVLLRHEPKFLRWAVRNFSMSIVMSQLAGGLIC